MSVFTPRLLDFCSLLTPLLLHFYSTLLAFTRISLQVQVLLLDEPTNHLDLHAVIWLEDYLVSFEKTLIIVSHAREFLNEVCTDTLHLNDKTIKRYKNCNCKP